MIRRIRGKLYFMFQLCELRKQQLVESHVRLYVVKNEVDPCLSVVRSTRGSESMEDVEAGLAAGASRNLFQAMSESSQLLGPAADPPRDVEITSVAGAKALEVRQQQHVHFIQTCSLRLNHPNDELGGMLLLMLPQVVVHEIDDQSPLMPPSQWFANLDDQEVNWRSATHRTASPGAEEGGAARYEEEKAMVSHFLQDRQVEIIAVVEGTDATTGGNVQARHSFLVDEIEWDMGFEPCLYKDHDDQCTTVDFSLFHELVPVSINAAHAGPICLSS